MGPLAGTLSVISMSRLHERTYVHRHCAKFDGVCHRRGARRQDAKLLCITLLCVAGPASHVPVADLLAPPEARLKRPSCYRRVSSWWTRGSGSQFQLGVLLFADPIGPTYGLPRSPHA